MDRFYGDDSVMDNLVAFFCVGVDDTKVNVLLEKYAALKSEYGILEEIAVHANVLFHRDKRAKSPFSHLNIAQVKNFITKTLMLCADVGMLKPVLAIAQNKDFSIPEERVDFENIVLDPKQGIHLLKNACLLEIHQAYNKNESSYKFYSDKLAKEDAISKNALALGGTRKRVKMPGVFVTPELSGSDDVNFRLNIEKYDDAPNKEVYELADIFLYICCKGLCEKQFDDKEYFIERFNIIAPRLLRLHFSEEK